MASEKIIYIWDPLCGWCYGFTSVIHQLKKDFEQEISFQILSGGLAVADKVGPVSQKAIYIKKKLPDVERISGVKFSEKYIQMLDNGTTISDSLPPSIAFSVFKSFREDLSFEFASRIQDAIFMEGKDLNNVKVYLGILADYEINNYAFMERFDDPEYRKLAEDDFTLTKSWGVEKYPSLAILKETGISVLQKGYESYEVLRKKIEEELC